MDDDLEKIKETIGMAINAVQQREELDVDNKSLQIAILMFDDAGALCISSEQRVDVLLAALQRYVSSIENHTSVEKMTVQ